MEGGYICVCIHCCRNDLLFKQINWRRAIREYWGMYVHCKCTMMKTPRRPTSFYQKTDFKHTLPLPSG